MGIDAAVIVIAGIRFGPAVMVLVGFGELRLELDGRDALGQFHDGRLCGAGVDKPLEKAFEVKAVDQHHVGLAHGDRVCRGRFVDMGVAIGSDNGGDVDPVAADVLRKVGNDGEGRDDLQRRGEGGRCSDRC